MIWQRVMVAGVWCVWSAGVALGLPGNLVERGERATALVDVNTSEGRAFGSAFCIDEGGVFVTDGHVVEGSTGAIKVVIRPGEKDQHLAIAHVLGIDYEADLAVMQLDNPGAVVKLVLGDSEGVMPTQEIVAFGYPFGNMLAMDKDSYPSITVNSGKVTALRKEKGELALIQVDALVNPGDSGGPVLDGDGKVVGLVESGVPGAGLNFATPVARLKKMLAGPLVVIDPVNVDYANRNKQQSFSISVNSLTHVATDYDLDFKITDMRNATQVVSGKTASGKCVLQVTPTADVGAIKWDPFKEPPPGFKFVLTVKQAGRVVGTEQGTMYMMNVPVNGEIVRGGSPRRSVPSGEAWPKENPLDALPGDAEDTPMIGADKTNEFREVGAAEHLAVGVQYLAAKTGGKPVFSNIRLIYVKPRGESSQTIVAKEGYVVGGMNVATGQYPTGQFFNGFSVIFIRQRGGKLDPSDTYTSDWVGPPSDGRERQLAGNGERVIGIRGRKGFYVRAIGLVIRKADEGATTVPAEK